MTLLDPFGRPAPVQRERNALGFIATTLPDREDQDIISSPKADPKLQYESDHEPMRGI